MRFHFESRCTCFPLFCCFAVCRHVNPFLVLFWLPAWLPFGSLMAPFYAPFLGSILSSWASSLVPFWGSLVGCRFGSLRFLVGGGRVVRGRRERMGRIKRQASVGCPFLKNCCCRSLRLLFCVGDEQNDMHPPGVPFTKLSRDTLKHCCATNSAT